MNVFIRALLVLLVGIGVASLVGETGPHTRIISTLLWLGSVSIFLGPLASEGGFWARFHYVDRGTPGCVWYALGIICWVIATIMIISAKQGA